MATYNPRAGMPPRKKYDLRYRHKEVSKTVTVEIPKEYMPQPGKIEVIANIDANALRSWLLGYMDSIGDQLPDLVQWRRIREEVGRSMPVDIVKKETAVPVKKVEAEPKPSLAEALKRCTDDMWDRVNPLSEGTVVWVGGDHYLTYADADSNLSILQNTPKNLCGND